MTLAELKALAQAATNEWQGVADFALEQGVHKFDAMYIAALSPERVLALIACVEAAKAVSESPAAPKRLIALDAAIAALEEQ